MGRVGFLRSRWQRAAVIGLGAVIGLILAARLFALTPWAHAMLEARIEAVSSRGQTVQIQGLQGDLLGRMSADKISVRDVEGEWLDLDDVEFSWSPFPLLFGRLDIGQIELSAANLLRRPELLPSTVSPSGLPVQSYHINRLGIGTLRLSDGVAGPEQAYRLDGSLIASGWTGNLELELSPLGSGGDEMVAAIEWGGESLLIGSASLSGVPGGLISQLFGAPSDARISASFEGSGGIFGGEIIADAKIGDIDALNLNASLKQGSLELAGTIDLAPIGRLSSLRSRVGDKIELTLARDGADRLSARAITANGTLDMDGVFTLGEDGSALTDFRLSGSGLNAAQLSGVSTLIAPDIRADGDLRFSDGVSFEGLIEVPVLGIGDYSIASVVSEGGVSFAEGMITISSALTAEQTNGLPTFVESLFAKSVSATLDANHAVSERRVRLQALTLRGQQAELSVSGEFYVGGSLEIAGDIRTEDVFSMQSVSGVWSLRGPTLSEVEFAFDGRARPSEAMPERLLTLMPYLDVAVSGQRAGNRLGLQAASIRSDALQANMAGALTGDELDFSGDLILDASSSIEALSRPVQAIFSVSGKSASPRSFANVRGAYLDAPFVLDGAARLEDRSIRVSDINGSWQDLMVSGAGEIDIAAPQHSSLKLQVFGSAPNIAMMGGEIAYANQALVSSFATNKAKIAGLNFEKADLRLQGAWPRFSGTISYDASVPLFAERRQILGRHPIDLDIDQTELTLAGALSIDNEAIEISSPIKVDLSSAIMAHGAVSALGGEAAFRLDNSGATPSTLSMGSLNLGRLGELIARPGLRGSLSGSGQIALTDSGSIGNANLSVENLKRGAGDGAGANIAVDLDVTESRLVLQAQADGVDEDVAFSGTMQTELTNKGSILSIRRAQDAAMPVSLSGRGQIAQLWAIFAPPDTNLVGEFSLDLSNGDGDTLRFAGPVSMRNGAFEDGLTGLALRQISADLTLNPSVIIVETASAQGANGGKLSASGRYNFDGPSSLSLELDRLNAFRRSDISATLSGTADVERQNRRTLIKGDLRLNQARVNLSKLPRAGYTVLDVQFDEPGGLETDRTSTQEVFLLDLGVRANRRVFVDGAGLESEWGIDAQVNGPVRDPLVSGQATLVRGEANLLGQRFALSDGTVRFVGAPQDTEVFLQADRTSDGITTSITLSGAVLTPEIGLSSDPSLPDDEVLSRVLFGRSPANLSPLQAAQLAGAAASLASGDALSLTGEIEQAIGLDRLDFGFDDEGAATLSTGKYLADDVYLEIESGGTGAPALALEWTPLDNVEVDAEIDPELGPKVAIQWKRDFDRLPGESDGE